MVSARKDGDFSFVLTNWSEGIQPFDFDLPYGWEAPKPLLRTIFEFRAFDNIYAMTGGGPANATMVLSMYTYLMSFVQFDFSIGAAASWLMLLMSMLMCLFFIAVLRRRETH